jgi:antitoxin VapB
MVLTIDNPETEKLARELARRRKQDVTDALTDVLRKEIKREGHKYPHVSKEEFHRGIQEIVDRVKKLPVLDDRPADEILGLCYRCPVSSVM